MDVTEARREFRGRLAGIKETLKGEVSFYPYSILSNLEHLDGLLADHGMVAEEVLRARSVNDIGGADGDLAFYCETLGIERVTLIDHAPTNHNSLEGARLLRSALRSKVEIVDANIDEIDGWQHVPSAELTLLLGILYHLQNPFLALRELARRSRHLLLGTKVFDAAGGLDLRKLGVAYFYLPGECNDDATNWWCFTDECLKRMIERAGWKILAYRRVDPHEAADPVDLDRDGRAFAWLRSTIAGAD